MTITNYNIYCLHESHSALLSPFLPSGTKKGTWSGKDDQLRRCRKTKKFEASLLVHLPPNSTFVDGGAHFGDTTLTLALYARETLLRQDINFIAFEPNPVKAQYIRDMAIANGLDTIRVFECVLGDETANASASVRTSNYCPYDGRTSYEWADFDSDEDKKEYFDSEPDNERQLFDIRRLDDFYDIIHPLGFLHLDVEGWEADVLQGASALLSANSEPGYGKCYILAECLTTNQASRRGPGFSLVQEHDISMAMMKYPDFVRGQDVVDEETNLFFVRDDVLDSANA